MRRPLTTGQAGRDQPLLVAIGADAMGVESVPFVAAFAQPAVMLGGLPLAQGAADLAGVAVKRGTCGFYLLALVGQNRRGFAPSRREVAVVRDSRELIELMEVSEQLHGDAPTDKGRSPRRASPDLRRAGGWKVLDTRR